MKEEFQKLYNLLRDTAVKFGVIPFKKIENHLIECRAKERIPYNSKSVILFVFPYRSNFKRGNLSAYAAVPDYHIVVTEKLKKLCTNLKSLFPENNFEGFSDNSPVPEVFAASAAGLGVVGKNSLLITPDYGSYIFIGEIITDLELSSTEKDPGTCLECELCEKVCPGKAIENGKVNTANCASDVSQKKGELCEVEKQLLIRADTIWGCDICQDSCPMNRDVLPSPIPEFCENIKTTLSYDEVEKENFKRENKDRAFMWRGKQVLLRNIRILNEKGANNND